MLNRLEISNYALIENAVLNLDSGFTSITGETGAGKSILLKALNLLLGERADTSVLKQSDKKCFLEAEFVIENLNLKSFFEANDLDYESPCIVRREFTTSGKSRCFVNDSPVQIAQLKSLGNHLVNIHSQHQTLDLFDKQFQIDVLDSYAGIENEAAQYKVDFSAYRAKVNRHIELQVKDIENRKEKDYTEFLLNELKSADLENTDLDKLKSNHDKIEYAEKISEGLALADSVFENETYGPHNGIKTLLETFEELKTFDAKFADIHARVLSLKIELDDLRNEIGDASGEFDFSETDAVAIKDKMDLLNSLCFKHNLTEVSELIALHNKLSAQMAELDGFEEELQQLEFDIEKDKINLTKRAQQLSDKRKASQEKLCLAIEKSLSNLSMEDAKMKVDFQQSEKLNKNGLDQIEFLFQTNKGGQFASLKKVASGGELSRMMLSIMSILSDCKHLPTLIFDEIDTGVSGEVAAKIAKEFIKMGEKIQLIAITHLPQVAAKGKHHLHVSKNNESNKTFTHIKQLTNDERVDELAKMISGEEITSAAKENALHLLNIS